MREGPAAAVPAAEPTTGNQVTTRDMRDDDDEVKRDASESGSKSSDQEFIFIHDTGFTVKIVPPGVDPFEIQVRKK